MSQRDESSRRPWLSIRQRDLRMLLAEISTCVGQDTRLDPSGERVLELAFEKDEERYLVEVWPDGAARLVQ